GITGDQERETAAEIPLRSGGSSCSATVPVSPSLSVYTPFATVSLRICCSPVCNWNISSGSLATAALNPHRSIRISSMCFEAYLKGENLKESTISQHILYVGYFQLWFNCEALTLQQITQKDVLYFIDHQKTEGRSVNQLNRILLSLRYWFSYLNKRNIIS